MHDHPISPLPSPNRPLGQTRMALALSEPSLLDPLGLDLVMAMAQAGLYL